MLDLPWEVHSPGGEEEVAHSLEWTTREDRGGVSALGEGLGQRRPILWAEDLSHLHTVGIHSVSNRWMNRRTNREGYEGQLAAWQPAG